MVTVPSCILSAHLKGLSAAALLCYLCSALQCRAEPKFSLFSITYIPQHHCLHDLHARATHMLFSCTEAIL